ncbi:MAG: hypothetical protein KBD21_05280 [Candidatus Pacebacteria bacterium]|nr:hypothetical protein [Candidatus Paceibacterota bacterium]
MALFHLNLSRSVHVKTKGSILIVTIIMMGVFSILFASLSEYLIGHYHFIKNKSASERALQIAEAGVEYYRWHLAHWPKDLTDKTNAPGPYVHTYEDPELGPIGQFSLEIGGEVLCGETRVVKATSTGWTFDDPSTTRVIYVEIARPTVADYSYIVDSNVYAGASRVIIGPYHSNGVIRMEGDNRSIVTSKLGTVSCDETGLGGCTASSTINSVYGNGTHPEWWRLSQPDISFDNFDVNFDNMESVAQDYGIYLPKISNDSSVFGYYLELQGDKTVDIYSVTSRWRDILSTLPDSSTSTFPELVGNIDQYRTLITNNRAIPQACPLIYVSDRTWISGTVGGKVTVIANATTSASVDIFLQNNITYTNTDGTDALAVLAERHLLIPLYVPNNMTINGIFFAQKGAYGRNYYADTGSTTPNTYRQRATLFTTGTVVSKLRTGTSWIGGTPDPQGFVSRFDNYDRMLAKSPPPLIPFTSRDFRFMKWNEGGNYGGGSGGSGGGAVHTISFVAHSTNDNGATKSIQVSIPAGSATDDLMIATVIRNAESANAGGWTAPAGWNMLYDQTDTSGGDRRTAIFYKIHNGAEATPTFTAGISVNKEMSGMIHTYRGVDTTMPFDVTFVAGSHKNAGADDATPQNRPITTVSQNALVVLAHFANLDDVTSALSPDFYTLRGTIFGGVKDNRQQFVADAVAPTPSTETPGSWNHVDNQNPDAQDHTTVTLVLRPAP